MASINQSFEERLEEELAKIDPATLQSFDKLLSENAPAARKAVQNALEEPISQEAQKSLQKLLLPKPYQPTPPPRQRKSRKMQAVLREYDPFPARETRTVTDYQNEILDLFDLLWTTQRKKGKKVKAGVSFDGASSEAWGET